MYDQKNRTMRKKNHNTVGERARNTTCSKPWRVRILSCRRAAFDTVVHVSRMQVNQPVAHTVTDSRPEDSEPQAAIEGIKLGNVEVTSQ